VSVLSELEQALGHGITADIFLLSTADHDAQGWEAYVAFEREEEADGQAKCLPRTFVSVDRTTGLPDTWLFQKKRSKLEQAERAKADVIDRQAKRLRSQLGADMQELVIAASAVCRHGLFLQFYRGEGVVFADWWPSLSQATAAPIAEVEPEVDRLEMTGAHTIFSSASLGAGSSSSSLSGSSMGSAQDKQGAPSLRRIAQLVDKVEKSQAALDKFFAPSKTAKRGMILAPILAFGEVMVGLLVLRNVDRLPHAVYKVRARTTADDKLKKKNEKLEAQRLEAERKLESKRKQKEQESEKTGNDGDQSVGERSRRSGGSSKSPNPESPSSKSPSGKRGKRGKRGQGNTEAFFPGADASAEGDSESGSKAPEGEEKERDQPGESSEPLPEDLAPEHLPVASVEAPEEGVAETLRSTTSLLGRALFNARYSAGLKRTYQST
jgi:hypothetical protein